jgi:hypothetical protein
MQENLTIINAVIALAAAFINIRYGYYIKINVFKKWIRYSMAAVLLFFGTFYLLAYMGVVESSVLSKLFRPANILLFTVSSWDAIADRKIYEHH